METTITLRKAERKDIPEILGLIRELAAYERAPDEVTVTSEDMERDGFGDNPIYEAVLAEANGVVCGMALYFFAYSTWKGKCIYLEDIIVRESHRRKGVGKLLFESVILKCQKENARRLMWQVLEWNEPAIHFYRKYHAILDNTWVNGKLTAEQIQAFVPDAQLTDES